MITTGAYRDGRTRRPHLLLINVITVPIVLHSIAFTCSLCSDFVWNKRYNGY